MPSSFSESAAAPPSMGPAVSQWGTVNARAGLVRDKRQQKLGLWSAVALQHHFTTTGGRGGRPLPTATVANTASASLESDTIAHASVDDDDAAAAASVDLRSHLGPATSLATHPHKPTLAQRMGLVPAPPPAPTAADWRAVVQRAMLRETQQGYPSASTSGASASLCSICQRSFAATNDEGQVILSCSHVFHAPCFRAFEQCVRAQQRADHVGVAEIAAPLACPVCRTQHYYKRTFYEGKALAQRAAIVKLQATMRGYLARRAYLQMRLQHNPAFRSRYVQERLTRLSAAWSEFCAQQGRRREATLTALAVQHQAARAAYMTEEEWFEVWTRLIAKSAETQIGNKGISEGTPVSKTCVTLTCPICLECLHPSHFTDPARSAMRDNAAELATGEDAVAAMRSAYEKRKQAAKADAAHRREAGKRLPNVQKPASKKTATAHSAQMNQQYPRQAEEGRIPKRVADAAEHKAPQSLLLPSISPGAVSSSGASYLPHSGVLLSCGHCFHTACLGCYERFNEHRMTELAGSSDSSGLAHPVSVIADRCPICRAGYAKHPL